MSAHFDTPPPGSALMRTILVVDDSPTMRRMIMASLRELRDVEFDQAASGLEAIERLALAPVAALSSSAMEISQHQ